MNNETAIADAAGISADEAERKPLLTGPKRQHFLPRFYLEGFAADDGCLAVYDRDKNEIRRQQPVNTGVAGHLYTVTDEQGRKRFELEAALSQVEGDAAKHLPTLMTGGTLSADGRAAIAHFLALLSVRTPEFIESIQAMNGGIVRHVAKLMMSDEASVVRQIKDDPKHADKSPEELREFAAGVADFVKGDDYVVTTDREYAVTLALRMADAITPHIYQRQWTVWTAPPRTSFVTADAPVVLTTLGPPSGPRWMGVGFGSADALVIVPLSAAHALTIWGEGMGTNRLSIDRDLARRVNLDVARRCQRFLLARDDAHALSISRAANLAQTQWKPKFDSNIAPERIR